jgi:hypothetical protein
MTTTINASTSSGLVVTPDNSGNVMLQYNGVSTPVFSAYSSGNQTGQSLATWTKAIYDTEEFDTANCFSSSRFTPNVAGYYQINAELDMAASGGVSYSLVAIYKNGVEAKRGSGINISSQGESYPNVSALIYMNGTTDYLEIYGYTGGSGSVTWYGNGKVFYFQGFLVRGA